MTTSDRAYRDLYYDDPVVQAEFERLVQRIRDAEQARKPVGVRQAQAELGAETGRQSHADYEAAEDAYIAAGNAIARAQREADAFLQLHRNYKSR